MKNNKQGQADFGTIIVFGIISIMILVTIFSTAYTIPAGYTGVLLTFDKVEPEPVMPGLHFKVPFFQKIVKMETRTLKYEADASASSSDLQIVTAKIATNYHLVKDSVPSIYESLGLSYTERVIQPLEQEVTKSVTAKYTAEELITKRELVRMEIKAIMTERLAERGIVVEEISIVNFDFSQAFNDAIENKVTQEQNALASKNKLEQIKFEAQQEIERAKGKAEAISIEGEALRSNPEIATLRAIEKWDGKMPLYTGGDTIPLINLGTK